MIWLECLKLELPASILELLLPFADQSSAGLSGVQTYVRLCNCMGRKDLHILASCVRCKWVVQQALRLSPAATL